jgi:repressor LexA
MLPLNRPPTARQLEVLDYLRNYLARHQRPPTRRDTALHFGIHVFAVQRHMIALERRGMLRREPGHRALVVTA